MKNTLNILGAALALTVGGFVVDASPVSITTQKAEAVTYTQCHTKTDGSYWCYQSNCTFWDVFWWGCNDGWRVSNRWNA